MKRHDNDDDDDVEIVHRVNRLKQKVMDDRSQGSSGFVDPAIIRKAQAVIDNSHDLYAKEAKTSLDLLAGVWGRLKTGGSPSVKADVGELCKLSNRMKDMASTYGYDLMSDFGESLRDFCETLDVEKKEHQVIVQAHIDVMWIAFNEKLKDHKGNKAEELKMIVNKAIEKYS